MLVEGVQPLSLHNVEGTEIDAVGPVSEVRELVKALKRFRYNYSRRPPFHL